MNKIGDIKYGNELGYKKRPFGKGSAFIWHACITCGKERWVGCRKGMATRLHCNSCHAKACARHGSANNKWKGGRYRSNNYIFISVAIDDFFTPMRNKDGYVLEHRLVMAKSLGRCLQSWEIVHHKNGVKDDNRIENLQLVTDDRHKQITTLEIKIKHLKRENDRLHQILKDNGFGNCPMPP